MLAEVAGGVRIAFIQELTNVSTIFHFASGSIALKYMRGMAILVLNMWCLFEEHINW
jgi:hypothetical protein